MKIKNNIIIWIKIQVANCKIFLFAKSSISNFLEYHLDEINNTRKQYNLNFVKYETFR